MQRGRCGLIMLTMAGLLASMASAAAPGTPPPAPFILRILWPSPLYLAGRCRVEAGALDRAGQPYDAVAWMSLSVDGGAAVTDTKPPFVWDLDLPEVSARHQLELSAVGKDGSRASLRAISDLQPFVERVGVDMVLVPVVVRDAGGVPRMGLKQSDFTVLENGAPQPIASFTTETAPAWVVLALDTSASMVRNLWSAQRALSELVQPLPAGTPISLLSFNDQVFMEQDFTEEKKQIDTAVVGLRAEGSRTAFYDAVRIGSAHLAKHSGTRAMVLFSDGEDTIYEGQPG